MDTKTSEKISLDELNQINTIARRYNLVGYQIGKELAIVGEMDNSDYTNFIFSLSDELPPELLSKIKNSKNKTILVVGYITVYFDLGIDN